MIVRPVRLTDIPKLKAMADESGFPYPDVSSPQIEAALVVANESDEPIMAVAAERIVQLYLFTTDQRPAVKLSALRMLHEAMAVELRRQGYRSAEAFLPPQVERCFSKRLERMFAWRKNWNSWSRAF